MQPPWQGFSPLGQAQEPSGLQVVMPWSQQAWLQQA
jgi:hypothetical protein